jgi:ubiquinone/menaquinone biosynthesis C-methylase UbiE
VSHLSDRSYLKDQYKDASKLNARIRLHARFSTNRYGWHRWVFDQFRLAPGSRVLELGCGPGLLWAVNLARIPDTWDITLSDFSPGMLQEARQTLSRSQRPVQFQVIDAQAIPFDDASLDAVIANHMLYHVPDRPRALAEIRRVLKPDGVLYASTIGETDLHEIGDLIQRVDATFRWGATTGEFSLENGTAQLARQFSSVTLHRYEDALVVTEAQPLIAYILSGQAGRVLVGEKQQRLQALIEQELAARGAIHISKDSGMFEARGSIS